MCLEVQEVTKHLDIKRKQRDEIKEGRTGVRGWAKWGESLGGGGENPADPRGPAEKGPL